MTVHGAFFEVTGAHDELFRIIEAIMTNDGRLTSGSSADLDLWQEMLEEWFKIHDAGVQPSSEILLEVGEERKRQINRGYTHEHDNNAGLLHLLIEAMDRLDKPGAEITHRDLVQAAALLVAAAEVI